MLRRTLPLAHAGLLLNLVTTGSAYAAPTEGKRVRFVEQVKKSDGRGALSRGV